MANVFLLNIDESIKRIIEAYTLVYGEQYRNYITDKLLKLRIFTYYNSDDIEDYSDFVKYRIACQYATKFLKKIGSRIEDESDFKKQIYPFLHSVEEAFLDDYDFEELKERLPILIFKYKDKFDEMTVNNNISLINILRQKEPSILSAEEYYEFLKSEDLAKVRDEVNKLVEMYEDLRAEYQKALTQVAPYDNYVENENSKRLKIFSKYGHELLDEFVTLLPESIQAFFLNKSYSDRLSILFGNMNTSDNSEEIYNVFFNLSSFELFSEEKIKLLSDKSIDYSVKNSLVEEQIDYLSVFIPELKYYYANNYQNDNFIASYLKLLESTKIKRYVPSDKLIDKFKKLRDDKYKKAIYEYLKSRDDVSKIFKDYSIVDIEEQQMILDYIEYSFLATANLIHGEDIMPTLFFSLLPGCLAYCFVHECGHAIDINETGGGFEYNDDEDNIYDNDYRRYELFNEIVTDIIAVEVNKKLRERDIYLFEPKEFTNLDYRYISDILVSAVYPFVSKYKQYVIDAKVNSDRGKLTNYIGTDNFEQLIDSVNRIGYLCKAGLDTKLKSNCVDSVTQGYFDELKKLHAIYNDMDEYHKNVSSNTSNRNSDKK